MNESDFVRFIHEVSGYLIYPLRGLILAFTFWILWRIRPILFQEPERYSKAPATSIARDIARQGKYYVQKVTIGIGYVGIAVKVADSTRKYEAIGFPNKHPDSSRLKQLSKLDLIEFEFVETAVRKGIRGDVCAYLRLKNSKPYSGQLGKITPR